MALDVARAYFYAEATRAVFIHIPAEDRVPEDACHVARLNLSFYGIRDAAQSWANTLTQFPGQRGFTIGRASPRNFHHAERNMVLTVHGDDFIVVGSEASLQWFKASLEGIYEIKAEFLGPQEEGCQTEVRILNRTIRWTAAGLE